MGLYSSWREDHCFLQYSCILIFYIFKGWSWTKSCTGNRSEKKGSRLSAMSLKNENNELTYFENLALEKTIFHKFSFFPYLDTRNVLFKFFSIKQRSFFSLNHNFQTIPVTAVTDWKILKTRGKYSNDCISWERRWHWADLCLQKYRNLTLINIIWIA